MIKLYIIFLKWLPFAVLITLVMLLSYSLVQQDIRLSANNPQIQLAEDTAALIQKGALPASSLPATRIVDLTNSLAPFVIIYDANGNTIASRALLDNKNPKVPAGVFQYAKLHGEERLTWQPKKGVRIAAVVKYVDGPKPMYVVAGRSLREVENLITQLTYVSAIGWVISLIALFITLMAKEFILNKYRKTLTISPSQE